jgi:uncharacterized protein (TIGR02246 family)
MKKMIAIKSILLVVILFSLSCKKPKSSQGEEEVFDMVTAKTAIETQGMKFVDALNKGDAASVANCYSQDAKLMLPNEKAIIGRENIQNKVTEWIKSGMPTFEMKTVDVWGDENQMVAEEEWRFISKDGKIVDTGKSLELFVKEDGTWKMLRDCFNSDMPCSK